jgi:hypothetical protein
MIDPTVFVVVVVTTAAIIGALLAIGTAELADRRGRSEGR